MTTETNLPAGLPKRPVTVLLVDDQAIVGAAVKRMFAGEGDVVFHFCTDPKKAVATAEEVGPTVILQDLVMPDIDGLTLVKLYRANEKTRDIPLIVLSTKEEPETKAEAFALGANDYLVKLPDRLEMLARVRYHSRGYVAMLQRNEAMRQLQAELDDAARYVTSLLPEPVPTGPVTIDWRFVTCSSLGGDAFGYHWLDDDRLVFYLLDVCGHGVGAALLSVSVANVLRSQSLAGTDFGRPDSVLTGLNAAFPMSRQNGSYFTIWYGVWNRTTRKLLHASGGHPAALMLTGAPGEQATVKQFRAGNLIIGFIATAKFEHAEAEIPPDARLYVFSDGVFEVDLPDGKPWPFDSFAEWMAFAPPAGVSKMDELLGKVRSMNGSDALPDDFSIFEAVFT